jgi:hypothetical protein
VDVAYGWWWHDTLSTTFTAAYQNRLLGPFGYGLGVFHLDDSRSLPDRTMTGGELSLMLGGGGGLYGVGSVALGIRHTDGNLDAIWSAGAGYRLSLFSALSLGADVRYRVQDQSVGGFWQLDPSDRKGFSLQAFVALGAPRGGRSGGGGGRAEPPPTFDPPSGSELNDAAHDNGVSEESAGLAVSVVQTALDAMGTPYDDILGFATNGGGVSHVGLYVGEGTFIHSASSGGVKLSSLTATDPESRWWRDRWIVGRRILN